VISDHAYWTLDLGESVMHLSKTHLCAAALVAALTVVSTTPAPASPLVPNANTQTFKSQSADTSVVIDVRYRHRNNGGAVAAGIAGLIIGGIIASQPQPYYYDPYYQPYPAYGGGIAYCARRFRSYDPYSMTYLGNDGYRHPCP
jgi:hypothetical protein